MAEVLEQKYTYNYIDPDKIYRRSHTSSKLLIQGVHQDNYPQGGVKTMSD